MEQVKTWVYILTLYVGIVLVDLISIAISVANGNRVLPYGWVSEIGATMLKCILDLIIVVIIGYGVEFLLRLFIKKTLIPNVVITIVIYKVLTNLVNSII